MGISLTEKNHDERLLLLLLRHLAGLPGLAGGDRAERPPQLPRVECECEQPSAQPLPHHCWRYLRVSLLLPGRGVLPVHLHQLPHPLVRHQGGPEWDGGDQQLGGLCSPSDTRGSSTTPALTSRSPGWRTARPGAPPTSPLPGSTWRAVRPSVPTPVTGQPAKPQQPPPPPPPQQLRLRLQPPPRLLLLRLRQQLLLLLQPPPRPPQHPSTPTPTVVRGPPV